MIDIEKGPLRAFEKDALVVVGKVLKNLRDVGGDRPNRLRSFERFIEGPRKVHGARPEILLQQEVVVVQHFTELGGELLTHEQI